MRIEQPDIALKTYPFLNGGGEMGELTRNFDWASTPVGSPDRWPQSLRTTVATLLNSKFPMFLWWGEALIQFYNDAYRPSLGNEGKHPLALGQKGKDCWPEIWDIIYPLIRQVLTTGESTWSEDQLVPIYRNGKIEDVYWTFGYSAVLNDVDQRTGVLVVCMETTQKIQQAKEQAESRRIIEESEERFRTMAEGADILIAVGDETSNAIYFNKAWGDLTGRPMADLLAFGWADLVHPEDRERYVNIYLSAFEKRIPFRGEFRILNNEGTYTWLLAQGPPRFRPDGSFAGYISACMDITEHKKREQQIRSLIDSAPFPIGVYTGKEMRIDLANHAMLEAYGKGNAVIGRSYKEILPELSTQSIFDQLDSVFTTGKPFHVRNQQVNIERQGILQSYYFNYSLTPLYDAAGNIDGVMNTAADVTDLNLAKQKIEENEKNFRNTILRAPVAMCILKGPEHVVEIANDRMLEIWGKTADEMMYKPIFDGLSEVRGQGFEELLHNVYYTGRPYSAQHVPVQLPRNGKLQAEYVDFLYEAQIGVQDKIIGVIVVAMLVTEQVKARQQIEEVVAERTKELAAANSNLQRSNADLSQFAYIASHDLQEPIRKVSTYSQMLESSLSGLNDQSKNYLKKITISANRMLTLIRDVLAYSELSRQSVVFTAVDLQALMLDIRTEFELLIEQKGAEFCYTNLPTIEAIPLQMSQLFSNLVSNALKFALTDIKPIITITAELQGQSYHIQVRDNGIGFNQDHAEQIFSIFQRLHRKTEYSGTGIGLAMCKKIAQNHQGDIYATSEPGKGTTFHIILPRNQLINGQAGHSVP